MRSVLLAMFAAVLLSVQVIASDSGLQEASVGKDEVREAVVEVMDEAEANEMPGLDDGVPDAAEEMDEESAEKGAEPIEQTRKWWKFWEFWK